MFFMRLARPTLLFSTGESAGSGTPAPAATEGTPEQTAAQQQAEIDWQKRYGDLQPEYTRATQEAAELRHKLDLHQQLLNTEDQDTQRELAQALGIELADNEIDDTPYGTPDEYLTRAEWKQFQTEQKQQRQAAQDEQHKQATIQQIDTIMSAQLDEIGVSKRDHEWIVDRALNHLEPVQGPNGLMVPDIKGAHELLRQRDLEAQKEWAKSKRAHQFSPAGGEGTQAPDLTNSEGRMKYMLSRLQDQDD